MISLNDIGKVEDKIGHPILLSLTFLAILPISTAYIDCRISCRRCHENTEHPSVLEVYCAMCEECKQRRREKIQGRSGPAVGAGSAPPAMGAGQVHTQATALPPPPPTAPPPPPPPPAPPAPPPAPASHPHPHSAVARAMPNRHHVQVMRGGYDESHEHEMHPYAPPQPMLIAAPQGIAMAYPPGCPTPPPCSESEEEVTLRYRETPPTTSTTTTTTTTTTTPKPVTTPCPPFPPCRKKRKKYHPIQYMPQMVPAMMPMMMPCMPCMPMCPYPCPGVTAATTESVAMLSQPVTKASTLDFQYVYIGIPKNALRS